MSKAHDAGRRPFLTTQWSMVVKASADSSPQARQALEELCEQYWYPLYAYVRRRGYEVHEAQDMTQGFFSALLDSGGLAAADPERGKFRTFLLSSLSNFLAKQHRHNTAQKRGGGQAKLSIDFDAGETQYLNEPFHELTPEKIFERRWAMSMLDRALRALEDEFRANDKAELFRSLKPCLAGDMPPYAEISKQIDMTESAIKVAVHRLRRRYREILRRLIAETVADVHDIDDELQYLLGAL